MRSTGSVDQIHPEQPDPGKIFSQFSHDFHLLYAYLYAGSYDNDVMPVSLKSLSTELAVIELGKCLACSCSELSTSA